MIFFVWATHVKKAIGKYLCSFRSCLCVTSDTKESKIAERNFNKAIYGHQTGLIVSLSWMEWKLFRIGRNISFSYRYIFFWFQQSTLKETNVLPIYCYHFANLGGTRGACFVFTDISISYLTSVKPNLSWTTQQPTLQQIISDFIFPECLSNYSSRITNHPSRTFTVTSGHVFMGLQLIS